MEKELEIYKQRIINKSKDSSVIKSFHSVGIQFSENNSISVTKGNTKIRSHIYNSDGTDLTSIINKENNFNLFEKLNSEHMLLKRNFQELSSKYSDISNKLTVCEQGYKKLEESHKQLFLENKELKNKREKALKELSNNNRHRSFSSQHHNQNSQLINSNLEYYSDTQFKDELDKIYKQFVTILFSNSVKNLLTTKKYNTLVGLEETINTLISKIKDKLEDDFNILNNNCQVKKEVNLNKTVDDAYNKGFEMQRNMKGKDQKIGQNLEPINLNSSIDRNNLLKNGPIKVFKSALHFYSNKNK